LIWGDEAYVNAVDYTSTWCTQMTGSMRFFRVIEGVALGPVAPTSVNISSVQLTPGGPQLTWYAPISSTFHVEWTDTLFPPNWVQVAAPVTSVNGIFIFNDDGIVTAPLGGIRFYRISQP
jgi:hypothetical protein